MVSAIPSSSSHVAGMRWHTFPAAEFNIGCIVPFVEIPTRQEALLLLAGPRTMHHDAPTGVVSTVRYFLGCSSVLGITIGKIRQRSVAAYMRHNSGFRTLHAYIDPGKVIDLQVVQIPGHNLDPCLQKTPTTCWRCTSAHLLSR
jgi:hypothetical protein